MKKISETRVAGVVKSFVDVRKWSDIDRLKTFFIYIVQAIQNVFSAPSKTASADSFDTVVQRYHLSEERLLAKQQAFFRIALSMAFIGCLGFLYFVYMLVHGSWRAVMLSLVVDALAWVLAFRYHFWYFQVKTRKLGVTFQEWYSRGLMGR